MLIPDEQAHKQRSCYMVSTEKKTWLPGKRCFIDDADPFQMVRTIFPAAWRLRLSSSASLACPD